ncbi:MULTISPECIES: alpha/beta hydrolase [unclassified Luteibacter]|uniref:alpha/beta fold hydrolase n=1 Tax=unclassified Luteibacter TaxID=2620188 RepID=UPI0008BC3688|nr:MULTISPECIES: alpha/beta hydrolase [unclassified Luteibacter]MDR6935986.1 pimeloyl-ACP methyl ester carboxylesterase [Luteibacter sp. 3190]SEV89756.1 Pimeloyl-ACP methyl ester carboxylesterase [Luteibacter sp. 329MFSha]
MNATSQPAPTIVLIHGAWADGSSWSAVIPRLLAKGLKAVAVQNPLTSLADDVAATKRVIDFVDGPVVLVGHSWAGFVVTEAGEDAKVKSLVYVSAFSGDVGNTTGELVGKYPSPPALGGIRDDGNGFVYLSEQAFVDDVAQDLPADTARLLAATQGPLAKSTFADALTKTAWRTRPSWFILSTSDRAVSPDLQRDAAKLMGSTVTEVPSSHMSLLSHADAVVDAIVAAAAAATRG